MLMKNITRKYFDGQTYYYVHAQSGVWEIELSGYSNDGFDCFIYRGDCELGANADNDPMRALFGAADNYTDNCDVRKMPKQLHGLMNEIVEAVTSW